MLHFITEFFKSEFFKESPLPIDATIFPTWPAKSEGFNKNKVTKDSEPRAPSPGKMYEQLLGDVEDGSPTKSDRYGLYTKINSI